MANRWEFGRTNGTAIGNVVDALKVNVSNIAAGGGSVSGLSIYYSPDDFTAVYAAADQLTIGAIANLPAVPDTTRFSKITVTRVDGTKIIYTADSNAMVYAAPTLTVTGAAFLATDLGYRVELIYQAKGTGVAGVAPNNYVNVFGGIDRAAANVSRQADVNAAGEVLVRSDAAANFLCTEANSALIEGHLDVIDNAIGTHDSARPSQHMFVGSRAHSGNPAPVTADDDAVDVLATLLGQLRVYMDSALNRVNDELKNEDIPPPEIVAGGLTQNSATIGNTTHLTATSVTLKRGVWLRFCPSAACPAPGTTYIFGVHFTSAHGSIIDNAGNCLQGRFGIKTCRANATFEGSIDDEVFIPIDDPSKLYIACNTANLTVVWSAV